MDKTTGAYVQVVIANHARQLQTDINATLAHAQDDGAELVDIKVTSTVVPGEHMRTADSWTHMAVIILRKDAVTKPGLH